MGDEEEPTPRAPCLADLGIIALDDLIELESTLFVKQGTFYDVLVSEGEWEVFLRVYSSASDCLRVLELRVRRCGERAGELLKMIEWPEVSKATIEGDCVELVIPSDPPSRILNALGKLGLREVKPIAYRDVEPLTSEEGVLGG